jgi:hypothetical protein
VLSTSFSKYPVEAYAKELIETTSLNETFKNIELNKTDLERSFLSINIYYSELKYTEIKQLEKQSIIDLICAIGGIFGLFIGASLLSFIEIIEGLILVLFECFKTKKNTKIQVFK